MSQRTKLSKIKVLMLFLEYRAGIGEFYQTHIRHLREAGIDIVGMGITVDPPGPRYEFETLNKAWKRREAKLMKLYHDIKTRASKADVLVLYNGANLHPEFVEELNTFNVYMSFDDPQSSKGLSQPVAKYFDACFVGNIACLNLYKSWGCEQVFFRPMGYFETHVINRHDISAASIRARREQYDSCLFCERQSDWREARLKYLEKHLNNFYGAGRGWPRGEVSQEAMLKTLQGSKIGINVHLSVGPVNLRTYMLPANGVMQICDNRFFLGQIFELGEEVVGYNSITQVPELVDYYLRHDKKRKQIAVAGWRRAIKDYNEVAVWKKQLKQIKELM